MNGFEKYAAYYRGYLADDRRLASVIGVLLTAVALWLLFYVVSLVGPASQQSLRYGRRRLTPPRPPVFNPTHATDQGLRIFFVRGGLTLRAATPFFERLFRSETPMPPPLRRKCLFAAAPSMAKATI